MSEWAGIAAILAALAEEEKQLAQPQPVYRPLMMSGGAATIPDEPPEEEDYMQASITLTDAQIKDVGTPYVIVPATEVLDYTGAPAQIPFPIAALIKLDNAAGAYTNVDAGAKFKIVFGSDESMDAMEVLAGTLGDANAAHLYQPLSAQVSTGDTVGVEDVPHSHALVAIHRGTLLAGNLQDNALCLVLRNGSSGDLTDGHADNSLTITVFYQNILL